MQGTKKLFWIVTPLITLASLFIWHRASSKLQSERDINKSTIESKFDTLDSIRSGNPSHPNDVSHEKMQGMIDGLKEDLREAWTLQFERQKGVLTWSDELGDEIKSNLAAKTPIEFKVPYPGQPIGEKQQMEQKYGIRLVEAPLRYREIYKIYAKKQLPELATKINADWFPGSGAASAGEGGGETAGALAGGATAGGNKVEESTALVAWSPANQAAILERFSWENRTPTTAEVMYAQEDLWVINQWMDVIARTNRGADARYNAAITEIISIELPQQGKGISLAGRIRLPGGGFSGEAEGESDAMSGMMGAMGAMGSGAGAAPGGAPGGMGESAMEAADGGGDEDGGDTSARESTAGVNDPIHLRYVDRQYQPLPATKLRSALNPNNTVPDDAYLAVAKRYPTRIRLKMDLRRLPDFLTACGNARLTIEVRQVGINSQAGASGAGGAGGSGGMEGMMGGGGMGGAMGGFGGGTEGGASEGGGSEMAGMAGMMGGGGGFSGAQSLVDEFPYQETVEIYAIVYLFNPPDTSKLGEPAVADGVIQPGPAAGAALDGADNEQLADSTR
jgi:hypothetical protein